MLTLALSALIFVVALAVVIALIDAWISGRFVFESLREERALLDAGFVPMATAREHRVRAPVNFQTLAAPARFANVRPGISAGVTVIPARSR